MEEIPVTTRFKRATARLDELARARLCSSSGNECSAESSFRLQDLVDNFMEREEGKEGEIGKTSLSATGDEEEMMERLSEALASDGDDAVGSRIRDVTGIACRSLGTESDGFKRRMVCQIRERGIDAGLCKSLWEKTSRFPAGEYEYVDVHIGGGGGAHYIVEVDLASEFEIARPTERYSAMVGAFPPVFVGRPDSLREVARLMGAAAKESMRSQDMHLPPWRRSRYMIAKWFGSYKRTTRGAAPAKASETEGNVAGQKSVGKWGLRDCRREMGLRVGNLALAFKDMHV